MTCNAAHPKRPQLACMLTSPNHREHGGREGTELVRWANEDYRSAQQLKEQSRTARSTVTRLADEVRATLGQPPAKPWAPRSKQGLVAAFLLQHVGEWIPGRRFVDPHDIDGGAQGLKRVRALRSDYGWDIEERPDPDPNTFVHQYRLVQAPAQPERYV